MKLESLAMKEDTDYTKEVRTRVNHHLDQLITKFYSEVPYAAHQLKDKNTNLEYYKRHVIEIILRLRMKRTIDALTIHYFTKTNPQLAKVWAKYTEDEMLHDTLFAKDLEKIGVQKEEIYKTEPMFTTKLLQGYFYYGLEHEGWPLASLCSSYFIEYTTQKTQPKWLDNLETTLGKDKIKGQRAHVNHDLEDDHTDFVWDVITKLVKFPEDEQKVFSHLSNVYRLFEAYFNELYQTVILKQKSQDVVIKMMA